MIKFIVVGIMLASVPFVSLAQTSTTTPTKAVGIIVVKNPGLVPTDFFYFLDNLSEAINLALTFNKEKEARLHIEYAKERVAEISEVLKNEGTVLEDVAKAQKDFNERIAKAAGIVKSEKESGKEVVKLAREIDDELNSSRDSLRDIFKSHRGKSGRAEEKIITLIAGLPQGDPQIAGLTKALESITKEKEHTTKVEDDLDIDFTEEEDIFDDSMGKEISSKKHADEVAQMMTEMSGFIPGGAILSSKKFLDKANAAHLRGDFEASRKLTKQAEEVLKDAEDIVEDEADEIGDMMDDDSFDDLDTLDLEDEINKVEDTMKGRR